MRLQVWLEQWWDRYSVGWRRSTQEERSPILTKWVTPYIGQVRLRDLGEARLRTWRARIIRDGCSPNRANAAMRVLSSALTSAMRERLIPSNPITGENGIRKLPHRVARPRVLAPVEIEAIRLAMVTRRDRLIVSLLGYAGLRPEEVCALRWSAVSDVALTIDEAYTAGELGMTKTGSRRVVALVMMDRDGERRVSPLVAELAAWRADYESQTRVSYSAQALVVPSVHIEDRSPHINWGWWRDRVFKPARLAASVDGGETKIDRCRPYDLRHSFASLLIHEGRPAGYVASQMGHAESTTTQKHYEHLFEESQLAPNRSMFDAITDARETLYEVKRSRFVPGGNTDPGDLDGWVSLMWPGFTPSSGRRGSNPRPQAWESPEISTQEYPVVVTRRDDDPDANECGSEDMRRSGTPDVPEMFPGGQWDQLSRDIAEHRYATLEHAAEAMRGIGMPDHLAGAPPHTIENHQRMAAGELVHPETAFGGHLPALHAAGEHNVYVAKGGDHDVDRDHPEETESALETAALGGTADRNRSDEAHTPDVGTAPSRPAHDLDAHRQTGNDRRDAPLGRDGSDSPATREPGTHPAGDAPSAGRADQRRAASPARKAGVDAASADVGHGQGGGRRPAQPGPGGKSRTPHGHPAAERLIPRSAAGTKGSTDDDTRRRRSSVHTHHDNNRRWWRTAAAARSTR